MAIADLAFARTQEDEDFIKLVYAPYFIAAQLKRDYDPSYIAKWFRNPGEPHSFLPMQILLQTVGYPMCREEIAQDDVRQAYENGVLADATGMGRQTGGVFAQRSRHILNSVQGDNYFSDLLDSVYIHDKFADAMDAGRLMEAAIRLESALDCPAILAHFKPGERASLLDRAEKSGDRRTVLHIHKMMQSLSVQRRDHAAAGIGAYSPGMP